MQQLSETDNIRYDNSRLKEFAKKQNAEMESLKKTMQANDPSETQKRYESALTEIERTVAENSFLKG
jgi:hypothetical protein